MHSFGFSSDVGRRCGADQRQDLPAKHDLRRTSCRPARGTVLPDGPRTNGELAPEILKQENLTEQHSNVLSLIDLTDPDFRVVDHGLFDDFPIHVLPHPNGERFVVGGGSGKPR